MTTRSHRTRRFLDDVAAGFVAALAVALFGYLLFFLGGCSAASFDVADPGEDDAAVADLGIDDPDGAPSNDAPATDDTARLDAAPDTHRGDVAPIDPDIHVPEVGGTCPSGRYCAVGTTTAGNLTATCTKDTECCSGHCYFPGDGAPAKCAFPPGSPAAWCGGRDGWSDWCPGGSAGCWP